MGNTPIRFASGHTSILDDTCTAIIRYLAETTGLPLLVDHTLDWPERYRQLDAGQLDLAWICGGPYVRSASRPGATIELLAAPIWRGERYADRPVYFADLIVPRDHPAQQFAELRGATWVYNEPGSLSGYDAMRYHLYQLRETMNFFGQRCASGGHLVSLQQICDGQADVTAIDSVILEEALRRQPTLADRIRRLDTVGPLPSMPWVVQTRMAAAQRHALRAALIAMHNAEAGRAVLAATPLAGFAFVEDASYDPIRRLLAEVALLSPNSRTPRQGNMPR